MKTNDYIVATADPKTSKTSNILLFFRCGTIKTKYIRK